MFVIDPVEFAEMSQREQATAIAEYFAILNVGESIEIPWSETACRAVKIAEWNIAKGLTRFSTGLGQSGNLRVTRIQGGIF